MTDRLRTTVFLALSIALVALGTIAIRIGVPATGGYMNLGDSMIFVTAIVFGRKYGLAAGGLGSALADILGGYATWAPWTLVIKGIEGYLAGMLYDTARSETRSRTESEAPSADESKIRTETKSNNRPRIAHILTATSIAGAWMVAGYFIAGTILYGFNGAIAELPFNLVQAGGSIAIAIVLAPAIRSLQTFTSFQ
ncbi:MAG: ECF transporter S component [Firmicutes bacterium]|nr:ECF transporter S component [Bacillota bacterium]